MQSRIEKTELSQEEQIFVVLADAVVGRGRVFRTGQSVSDCDLGGYGEVLAKKGALVPVQIACKEQILS